MRAAALVRSLENIGPVGQRGTNALAPLPQTARELNRLLVLMNESRATRRPSDLKCGSLGSAFARWSWLPALIDLYWKRHVSTVEYTGTEMVLNTSTLRCYTSIREPTEPQRRLNGWRKVPTWRLEMPRCCCCLFVSGAAARWVRYWFMLYAIVWCAHN